MKEFYDAYQILVNECKWIDLDESEIDKALREFASFVAATARGNRRRRIMDCKIYNVKHWGILRRLWYYPKTGKVEYCCGQDWDSEMATLRSCFDWKDRR